MSQPYPSIAIAGGLSSTTGYSTGQFILKSLLSLPNPPKVVVLGRASSATEKKAEIEELENKGAKFIPVDYADEGALLKALGGVTCVVSTVAVRDPTGWPRNDKLPQNERLIVHFIQRLEMRKPR